MTTRLRTALRKLTALTFFQTDGQTENTQTLYPCGCPSCPSVVAVKKTPPEANDPPEVLQNLPGGWFSGMVYPPGALGSLGVFSNDGNACGVKNLAVFFKLG
jgi:hypothetical protein